MHEIIFNAQSHATLMAEARRLGFVTKDVDGQESIIKNGTFASGGGWFLNIVGIVYEPIMAIGDINNIPQQVPREGYWGRLRINGEPPNMPLFSEQITQYVWSDKLKGLTCDGITLAPEWVANIAIIS